MSGQLRVGGTCRPAGVALAVALSVLTGALTLGAQGQSTVPPPVPKPFPQPTQPAGGAPPVGQPPAPTPPATTAAQTPDPALQTAPSETLLGVRVYPGAEFLGSVDAGKGQRYYLWGTNTSYSTVVDYYKTQLKNGRELFKAPAMWQFDLPGKFQEETMAYPPSVVVKDYTWNGFEGYLQVVGTQSKRFRTVLQIVPAVAR